MVRAPDCGSGCRGFESHQPPKIASVAQLDRALDFDPGVGGSSPPGGTHRRKRNEKYISIATLNKLKKILIHVIIAKSTMNT